MTASPLLRMIECTKAFGGLIALSDFSVEVPPGELLGLIGPNGAGKTTAFNLVAGVYQPTAGEIWLEDQRLDRLPAWRIASLGLRRTFQNIRLFRSLTVLDNAACGAHLMAGYPFWKAAFRTRALFDGEARIRESAMEVLSRLGLADLAEAPAGSLPYGSQRRVEIARALIARPRLLLLDEPAAGMNPMETTGLMDFIRQIRADFDLTIVLIEHDMRVVMGICDRIIALDQGRQIAEGSPAEVRANPRVIEAYLGEVQS